MEKNTKLTTERKVTDHDLKMIALEVSDALDMIDLIMDGINLNEITMDEIYEILSREVFPDLYRILNVIGEKKRKLRS